ncbi:BQ00720 family protein [Martelella soudanensis]|uniref:BQ00720 family protein n=1 Tax=unclassified Martelella TaxID=2629616 RepID=UPI0015DFE57E|nr:MULTISPECIES: DUF1150 family protein [unclassified Martelella]
MKIPGAELSLESLAAFGTGHLGYFREFERTEALRHFPDAAGLKTSEKLWALFGADGALLLLTENRTSVFFKAMEDDLKTVTLH